MVVAELERRCCVQGYHAYMSIRQAVTGETLDWNLLVGISNSSG